MSDLTPKQARFVAEYLLDSNATQAAIRAGYSKATAAQGGAQLLRNIKVRAEIDAAQKAAMAKAVEKYEVSQDRIIRELALLGYSNMQDFASVDDKGTPFLDMSKLNRDQWAAVQSIKVDDDGAVTLKLYDKRASLVDLHKHSGLYTEKQDHKVTVDATETTPLELARGLAFVLASAQQAAAAPPIPGTSTSNSNRVSKE